MRSTGSRVFAGALAVILSSSVAQAQLINLRGGEVGGSFVGMRSRSERVPSGGTSDYRLWLKLPVRGWLINPGILSYTVTVKPVLTRQVQSGPRGPLDGQTLDGTVGLQLLERLPVNLSFTVGRANGRNETGFGSERRYETSDLRTQLEIRFKPLPIRLTYATSSLDETWETPGPGQLFRTAFVRQEASVMASNSKTSFRLRRWSHDDLERDADIEAWSLNVANRIRWGRASRLETDVDVSSQRGSQAIRRSAWSERLKIQHASWLNTEHRLRHTVSALGDATPVASTAWNSGFEVQPLRGWSIGLQYGRSTGNFGTSRQRVSTLTPRMGMDIRLGRQVLFRAQASVGIERRLGGVGGPVPVVDERHDLPPNRSFQLEERNVIPGSIIIRDGATGVLYIEGSDYRLAEIGAVVRVDVPPDSRIQLGQVLLLTYRFRIPEDAKSGSLRADANAHLQVGRFSLDYRRSERRSDMGHGEAAVGIGEFLEQRFTGRYSMGTPFGQMALNGSWKRTNRFTVNSTSADAAARVNVRPLGRWQPTVGATWSTTRADSIVVQSVSIDVGVDWRALSGLTLQTQLSAFRWIQTGEPRQSFLSARVSANWRILDLELRLWLEHHRRSVAFNTQTSRFGLGFLRRF